MGKSSKWKVVVIAGTTAGFTLGGFTPATNATGSAPQAAGMVSAGGAAGKYFQTWGGGPHPAGIDACADSSFSSVACPPPFDLSSVDIQFNFAWPETKSDVALPET